MSLLGRRHAAWLAAALAALALLWATVLVVPETQQVLILRFGQPARIANRYAPGEAYGRSGAGLVAHLPLVEQVVRVDRRVRDLDVDRQAVRTADRLRLDVDAYARFRIVDPVRMYGAAGSERQVGEALRPILGSALRGELGRQRFADLLGPGRDAAAARIAAAVARAAAAYGVAIVDVRIRRVDLPDGAPLQSAIAAMRDAQSQRARSIRAEGRRQAQIMVGDADAQAARIYADSFGKDPGFYDFYRAMQSYRQSFGTDDPAPHGSAQVILGRDSDYLRQFVGGK